MREVNLHLLRHGRVASHRGDVPLADDADKDIHDAADRLAAGIADGERIVFLTTATRRSSETAEGIRTRLAAKLGAMLPPCVENRGLRNPDLYLGGARVEMVSTLAAFAAQLPEGTLGEADVVAQPFFSAFVAAPDRIAFWLDHPSPPGENAADVARRILNFGASFLALPGERLHVVCVSHSPVQRAVLVRGLGLADPGEPAWVEDVALTFTANSCRYRFRRDEGRLAGFPGSAS